MTFGANCLVDMLNTSIVGLQTYSSSSIGFTTSNNFTQVAGSLNSLDTSTLTVNVENDLPLACDNIGRFVYIKCEGTFRYSDGLNWKSDTNSTSYNKLWGWGNNGTAQLMLDNLCNTSSPTSMSCNDGLWCKIADHSGRHAVALKTDGTLWSWGCGAFGELGSGNCDGPSTVSCPVYPIGARCNWSKVAAGFVNTAAIKTDGTLWTWGANCFGKHGDGTTVCRCSPGTVAGGGTTWSTIAANYHFLTATKTDGTLWSWGQNNAGQLGDGTTVNRCSPGTTWGSYTTWSKIDVGMCHSVAIKNDGTLWTWGSNNFGQLGDGTTVNRCSPGTVAGGGTTWCQVSLAFCSTLAIKTDGTLWTWGQNCCGILANNVIGSDRCSPGSVIFVGTTWCKVSAGRAHAVAIKTDGTLWTWGANIVGQIGDGTTVNKYYPVNIMPGTTNWVDVAGNFCGSFALRSRGF